MGSYISGMINKNKLPLSLSLSFEVSIQDRKLLTTIVKSFSMNTILCFSTRW